MKSNRLTLKWLEYKKYESQIQFLRKTVFLEEQGIDVSILDSAGDEKGLHLGLFDGGELVASVSLFPFEREDDFIRKELGIKSNRPYVIQYSKRAELPRFRNQGYSALILAHAMRSSYELFQPDVIFALLVDQHVNLKNHYLDYYRFNRYEDYSGYFGEGHLLLMDDQETIDKVASHLRFQSIKLSETLNVELPDLTLHLTQSDTYKDYLSLKGDETNRYLKPLSLEDELPRLSNQTRMLFNSQVSLWQDLLTQYPNHKKILDMGCGPGIYLSLLNKLNETSDRQLVGMDISDELITYSQFAHRRLEWKVGSVYDTKLESCSVDIIHCSFLFIHLVNPFLALKELWRILSPDGILYISDANDGTFEGPAEIKDLIEAHNEIYEGNRNVMSSIVPLAEKAGFTHILSDDLTVDNTGVEQKAEMEGRRLKLGRLSLWGMFSFLGQRSEVKDQFEIAEQSYFKTEPTLSIEIQTRIFKKR